MQRANRLQGVAAKGIRQRALEVGVVRLVGQPCDDRNIVVEHATRVSTFGAALFEGLVFRAVGVTVIVRVQHRRKRRRRAEEGEGRGERAVLEAGTIHRVRNRDDVAGTPDGCQRSMSNPLRSTGTDPITLLAIPPSKA